MQKELLDIVQLLSKDEQQKVAEGLEEMMRKDDKPMLGLEYALEITHMSQTELADKLGIKKQNINLWLSGKQAISKKHLPTIETILGIPSKYLTKNVTASDKIDIQYIMQYGMDAISDNKPINERKSKLLLLVDEITQLISLHKISYAEADIVFNNVLQNIRIESKLIT